MGVILIFGLICVVLVAVWEILPILLVVTVVGVIIGAIIYYLILKRYETEVVETEIIREEPIIKQQAEETGYTISYGRRLSGHRHYKYKDVQVGEKITFKVLWKNDKVTYVTCNNGDETFKRLYRKLKK